MFNVDASNWFKNLIQIAGSNACGILAINANPGGNPPVVGVAAGTPYNVISGNGSNAAIPACTISVTVTDLKLYLCRAHVTNAYVPRSITQTMVLK